VIFDSRFSIFDWRYRAKYATERKLPIENRESKIENKIINISADMKSHTALPLLAALALLATACSSTITNIRERFSPTYQTVTVEAEQRAAFDASLAALKKMGYNITSSGAAQGKIEAISPIASTGGTQAQSRQTTASVRFGVAPGSGTAIQILFSEIVDNTTAGSREGFATKQPLSASSPLYAVFANYVANALKK